MITVRLLPLIFSVILIAAHVMRFNGLYPALLVLALLLTLFIRSKWTLKGWQIALAAGIVMWAQTTYNIVQMRMAINEPWLRLAIIMGAVIAFTLYSILSLENKKIKAVYEKS